VWQDVARIAHAFGSRRSYARLGENGGSLYQTVICYLTFLFPADRFVAARIAVRDFADARIANINFRSRPVSPSLNLLILSSRGQSRRDFDVSGRASIQRTRTPDIHGRFSFYFHTRMRVP